MANEKVEPKETPAKPALVVPKPAENPQVKFLVWFTAAMGRFEGLKAHHMTAVRAYVKGLGLPDPAPSAAYDEALKKYGLMPKKK